MSYNVLIGLFLFSNLLCLLLSTRSATQQAKLALKKWILPFAFCPMSELSTNSFFNFDNFVQRLWALSGCVKHSKITKSKHSVLLSTIKQAEERGEGKLLKVVDYNERVQNFCIANFYVSSIFHSKRPANSQHPKPHLLGKLYSSSLFEKQTQTAH